MLSIFTRDLGLVLATAQGIRLEKSKLRYHSQEYSFGEFSFVRGKEFWRLTNADSVRPDLDISRSSLTGRVAFLLCRLLHGEEAHVELFGHIERSFLFLEDSTDSNKLSAEQMQTLESIIVFRILHLLGYIGTDKKLDARIIGEPLSTSLIDEAMKQRTNMNRHINKALKESHL